MEDRQVAVAVVLGRASLAEREAIARERDREDRGEGNVRSSEASHRFAVGGRGRDELNA